MLQSDQSGIRLLPALPVQWSEGSFQGLKARGGLKVDLIWKDCKPVRLTVYAKKPRRIMVRFGGEGASDRSERNRSAGAILICVDYYCRKNFLYLKALDRILFWDYITFLEEDF